MQAAAPDQSTQAQTQKGTKATDKTPAAQPDKTKKKVAPVEKPDSPPASYLLRVCSIAPSNNAQQIQGLVGNPKPFTVKVRDERTLLIYGPTRVTKPSDLSLVSKVCA